MEREFGKDISDLLEFEKEIKTDVHKLWDNVYDMQELGNITSRYIDEMYDKDILILHNFRTETTNQLSKLQNDMETILRSVGQGYYEKDIGSNENSSGGELEKLVSFNFCHFYEFEFFFQNSLKCSGDIKFMTDNLGACG